MFCAFLPQRAIISLYGDDTIEFLQGLISNDARLLTEGKSIYAALLSPQGKFLHDFFLIPCQGKIFIDVLASRAEDLLTRIKIYRLRSKFEVKLEESLVVAALWGGKLEPSETTDYKIFHDPRLPELGLRIIGGKNSISQCPVLSLFVPQDEKKYEHFRLTLGIPDTDDMVVGKSLLLEYSFEQLHGVDFAKGCYIGQEVTARSKFRGQVRKSLYIVRADADLPEMGTEITVDGENIGEIRSSLGNIGLAILYNDKYGLAQSQNKAFFCGRIEVLVSQPEWIKNASGKNSSEKLQ